MDRQDAIRGLAVFLSNYAKRALEGQYDKLGRIRLFQELKRLPKGQKYAIEAVLYLLSAVFERHFREDTFLRKSAKEVGEDFASEFSKRPINGQPGDQLVIEAMLMIDQDKLRALLDWLYSTGPDERERIIRQLARRPLAEIERLAELPPEYLGKFLDTFGSTEAPGFTLADHLEPVTRRLKDYIEKCRREKGENL